MRTGCRCGNDLGHPGMGTECGPLADDVQKAHAWAILQKYSSVSAAYARILAYALAETEEKR